MTRYWEGTRHLFLLTLLNFKNIGGGAFVTLQQTSCTDL